MFLLCSCFLCFVRRQLTCWTNKLVGLIRTLRSVTIQDGITINGVAPAATITKLLPAHLGGADYRPGAASQGNCAAGAAREVYGKDREAADLQKGWFGAEKAATSRAVGPVAEQ
jgi:hypothetical protein